MKRLLSTAAMALVLGGPAAYAASDAAIFSDATYEAKSDFYASDLIGMRIYATERDVEAAEAKAEGDTMAKDGEEAENLTAKVEDGEAAPATAATETSQGDATRERDWSDIGEVNDLIITRDGKVEAVIVGVGGFLGIGEKDVALDMNEIKVQSEDDGSRFLVVNATAQMLEEAPTFERADPAMESKRQTGADATAETPVTDADKDAMAAREPMTDANGRAMLNAPTVEREGYAEVKATELTADQLQGATVYGVDDESVGEISEIVVSDSGKIDRVIVDVGGFLGMGEKPVALTFDELRLMRQDGGDDLRVYVDATEEALESQPTYEPRG